MVPNTYICIKPAFLRMAQLFIVSCHEHLVTPVHCVNLHCVKFTSSLIINQQLHGAGLLACQYGQKLTQDMDPVSTVYL